MRPNELYVGLSPRVSGKVEASLYGPADDIAERSRLPPTCCPRKGFHGSLHRELGTLKCLSSAGRVREHGRAWNIERRMIRIPRTIISSCVDAVISTRVVRLSYHFVRTGIVSGLHVSQAVRPFQFSASSIRQYHGHIRPRSCISSNSLNWKVL